MMTVVTLNQRNMTIMRPRRQLGHSAKSRDGHFRQFFFVILSVRFHILSRQKIGLRDLRDSRDRRSRESRKPEICEILRDRRSRESRKPEIREICDLAKKCDTP